MDPETAKALESHPCYNAKAHHEFARMHLPVAPRCNIQCNFCNRKFDCCNESRPGVTSEILTPEQAIVKIRTVKEAIPKLSVIGIAGPGDPLANEETFATLEAVHREFPELTLCVSTNGLALPDCADRLHSLGLKFITVTMNASNPSIGSQIYDSVIFEGERLTGEDGAKTLIEHQLKGITRCVELGMTVKVNIVMIPGINDSDIPILVKRVRSLGVYMVNILPLIPVEGTKFASLRAPTPEERRDMMDLCELDVKMMRHCRQCRADAIGLLGEDRSAQFTHIGGCGSGCGPNPIKITGDENIVAIATSDGRNVGGFGSASAFRIYATDNGTYRFLREIPVDRSSPVFGDDHVKHIDRIISSLDGCGTIIVKEIGEMPTKRLSSSGVRLIIKDCSLEDAIHSLTSS